VDADRNGGISRRGVLAGVTATPTGASWAAHRDPSLAVLAAASLREAMDRAGYLFVARRLRPVKFSYGASSALARQIEQGASADVFISADSRWMDHLAKRHLIVEATRRDLFSSHTAIIYPGAVVATSKNPLARAFLDNLRTTTEANVFRRFGFKVLE